jgi:hypothetical protein
MSRRRFFFGLSLCILAAVRCYSVAIKHFRLDDIVNNSDLIAIVEVIDVSAIGAAPAIPFRGQLLDAQAFASSLRLRRIIKGTAPDSLTVEYALPTSFVGYRGLQRGTRMVFLRLELGQYVFVDPYHPDLPALVPRSAEQRLQPARGDYATIVLREILAVIASAAASPNEKSQVLQIDYALPTSEEVVAAFRDGVAVAQEPDLRQRLQGELLRFGDVTELPQVANLLLTNTATTGQRAWLLYVIGYCVSDRRAIPALEPLLHSGDNSIREAAVEALWHIADPSAVPQLAKNLRDPDEQVRFYAVRAFADIANEAGWGGPGEAEFRQHQEKYLTHWQDWAKNRAQ